MTRRAYAALDAAFAGAPHAIHYALKANSTLAIVGCCAALGSGADANSVGEMEVALRAGFTPAHRLHRGGEGAGELERAVALGLMAINVESPGELDRLDGIARARAPRRGSRCG